MAIDTIHDLIATYDCQLRLQMREALAPSEWSAWVSAPVRGYIETFTSGPWRTADVAYLEINPVATTYIGRLVPARRTDHRAALESGLTAAGLTWEPAGPYLRVFLPLEPPA